MSNSFSSIEDAVDAINRGEMAIVLDDEDRENEGDLICAAEKITPQGVNFMLKYGKGRICIAILPEVASRLKLQLMVDRQPDSHRTEEPCRAFVRVIRIVRSRGQPVGCRAKQACRPFIQPFKVN